MTSALVSKLPEETQNTIFLEIKQASVRIAF